jgi:RNA polymerase sigma-70 factor (ECF subfamily)
MKEISEETIRLAAQGDRQAFGEIYRACSGFVYTVALRILGNSADAEEVTQEVFIKLFRTLKEFEFRSTFKTWLYRVTANSAINAYNARKLRRCRSVDFEEVSGVLECPQEQRSSMEYEERQKLMHKLLERLPARQRACMVMREIEGLSCQEIAAALKTNINTVRTWLKRGRELLMQLYGEMEESDGLQTST